MVPIALVLLYPAAMVRVGGSTTGGIVAASEMSLTLISLAFAATAALWACEWRLSRDPAAGGAAAAAAFLAIQHLPPATWGVGSQLGVGAIRLDAGHALVALGAGWLLTHSGRGVLATPNGPPLVGLGCGVVLLSVRVVVLAPDVNSDHPQRGVPLWVTGVLVVIGSAYLLRAIARCDLPLWVKRRSTAALALTLVAELLGSTVHVGAVTPGTVASCGLAAALLLGTTAGYLSQTAAAQRQRTTALLLRTARSEARVKHERETAHEVRTTVAGIAAAAQLLGDGSASVTSGDRVRLAGLIADEVGRLARLVGHDLAPRSCELDLDTEVDRQVTAHRALGEAVTWSPSGAVVVGDPDSLSTVLDILLSNAARHAGRSGAVVRARPAGDQVEVRVSDKGPGVDDQVAKRLFRWNSRSRTSVGSGIGLQLAHRLMREQGGDLRLDRSASAGATFLLTLPGAGRAEGRRVTVGSTETGAT
jgi:signal transduction histidine kinase